ncbi:lytic transglycosylase domain-containing protein [Sulfurirhabdus autotrophica]|uniref:Transglycosylase-like protein with SLT domain n=1 Tax=Sulfurirhabdus autotrophica TaxID=1706046 RepID=A0A4R3YAZ8_9PROT|nr:lytic transglycosylase domain-containing protein [Sulfurirhabdus autotrophica]TCV89100.1 transglycosylase-like protein with SLT domain [Sulfurirhabdus autotrophica]
MYKIIALLLLALPSAAQAGAQAYEKLDNSAKSTLRKAVGDTSSMRLAFANESDAHAWISEMSQRMQKRIPDEFMRVLFLKTLHYEATRAGLDPQLVLGLTQVESGFKKYAISSAGARGYMQVMPFWLKEIGNKGDNLFDMRTNLRFGCTILRFYLDREKGDLFRALGRYNGSLGKAEYPNMVVGAWRNHWAFQAPSKTAQNTINTPG